MSKRTCGSCQYCQRAYESTPNGISEKIKCYASPPTVNASPYGVYNTTAISHDRPNVRGGDVACRFYSERNDGEE